MMDDSSSYKRKQSFTQLQAIMQEVSKNLVSCSSAYCDDPSHAETLHIHGYLLDVSPRTEIGLYSAPAI